MRRLRREKASHSIPFALARFSIIDALLQRWRDAKGYGDRGQDATPGRDDRFRTGCARPCATRESKQSQGSPKS
jgi:hypothetical protein